MLHWRLSRQADSKKLYNPWGLNTVACRWNWTITSQIFKTQSLIAILRLPVVER